MIQLLLLSTLAAIAAGLFCLAGAGILRVLRIPAPATLYGLFLRLIFGLSAVLTIYAAVRTGFNTVLSGVLLSLGGVSWWLRKHGAGRQLHGSREKLLRPTAAPYSVAHLLLLLLSAAALMTALRFPLLYNFASGHYDAPFLDIVYYAKLTFPLNQQGVESSMLEPGSLVQAVPQPYHYFELWLNALLAWATPLAPAVSLFVLTYSLLLTVVYIGYCALFEHFGQPRHRALLLGAACLFIAGVFLPVFNRNSILVNSMFSLLPYLAVFPKLAPVYIFMLLGFLLYVKGHGAAALWAWVAVPVVFVSTAPAMMVALTLLAIGMAWRTQAKLADWLALLLPMVSASLFIGLFYVANKLTHPQPVESILLGGGWRAMLMQRSEWITSLHVVVGAALAFLAYYFWYGGILMVLALSDLRRAWQTVRPYAGLLGLVGSLFVVGLLLWGAGYHLLDAWQFFNNALVPAVAALIAALAAMLLRGRRARWAYSFAGAIGLLVLVNVSAAGWRVPMHATVAYDPAFLAEVKQLAPVLSPVGAYVLGPADYNGPYAYNAYTRTPAQYLSLLRENTPLVNISHVSLNAAQAAQMAPAYQAQITAMIESTAIRRFARQRRAVEPALTDEQLQREFVLREHITFVVVAASGELPASLKPLAYRMLQDPVTGEKLYLLRAG